MSYSNIEYEHLKKLSEQLSGTVIKPGDADYDNLRTGWNGLFDKFPAAIVRCKNSDDVVHCIHVVREKALPFSVKSSGHDYAGNSLIDGGLVIDLSKMKNVDVNSEERTGRAGPGVTWGQFDAETQKHGLATTGGTVSTVGIAGYTLGGGTGYLARKHGLALDNLISVEIVTANGEKHCARKNENTDLFWAIRGGSGNFGIVTSFEYRLHKIGPKIIAGQIVYPHDKAEEVLRFYRDFMSEASDDLTCYAFFLNVPPIDIFPEESHGKSALSIVLAHSGSLETANKELTPLLSFGDQILTAVQPMPYTEAQQMFDEGMGKGNRWYSKAHYLNSLSDEAIETIKKFTGSIPGPFSVAYLEPMGGAINRIDTDETAYPHRDAAYGLHIFPGWEDPDKDDVAIEWAKKFYKAMSSYSTGAVYVNLLGHDEKDRVPHAYGSNYEKLVRIKKKWDPDNLFRSNHNILAKE